MYGIYTWLLLQGFLNTPMHRWAEKPNVKAGDRCYGHGGRVGGAGKEGKGGKGDP